MEIFLNNHPELFKPIQKKPIQFVATNNFALAPKKSYYIHEETTPLTVVTKLNNQTETKNTALRGDIVITGVKGEQYIIKPRKFFQLYNLEDEIAIPRPFPKLATKVTKKLLKLFGNGKEITFIAPWNESMIAQLGDYIVKDGDNGFYRIEKEAFKQTYNIL